MKTDKTATLSETLHNIILILLFVCAIFIPAAGHMAGGFDVQYIKESEKRSPNHVPDFPNSPETIRAYPRQLNAYFNDYFGFRSWLVSKNNLLRLKLGTSPSERVIRGKEGWLFYTGEDMVDQYRGIKRYTSSELNRWVIAMEERKTWLAQKKIPFIIVVPPNKMTIYPEYLPDWISRTASVTQLDQLVSAVKDSQLDFIDLRSPIMEAKKRSGVYYMTDSHWNHHGGFAGYMEIMKRVKKYFPDLVTVSMADVNISYHESPGMDLCNMLNISDYKKEPYADRVSLKKPSHVLSETFLGKGPIPKIVRTSLSEAPRVLVFRDSYTINMEPFFNETFQEIIYAGYDIMKFDSTLIEQYKPDLVIHIMIERALRYKPFNPTGVSDDKLRISNWGPVTVQLGKKFNAQPNNMSAMWIIGQNITPNTIILWNKHRLKTIVNMETSVVSAFIPDSVYAAPGKYEIQLHDTARNESSESVEFVVTD